MPMLTPSSLVGFLVGGITFAVIAAAMVAVSLRAAPEPVSFKECATRIIVFEFASGDRVICAPVTGAPAKPKARKGTVLENAA